jgi:hypothetical protein
MQRWPDFWHLENMILRFLILSLFSVFFVKTFGQTSQTILGRVEDVETGAPLAFASVGFAENAVGTISNEKGFFQLHYPASLQTEKLTVSFIGYESFSIIPTHSSDTIIVKLKPVTLELHEVVVRPHSPQFYIKRAVTNFENAYPVAPFGSKSYYQEMITENGNHVSFTECLFKSFYPTYQDTSKSQHQLLLYRKKENPQPITFMRDKIDKEKLKDEKSAKKKGEEYVDDEKMLIESTFGGPGNILSMDLVRYLEPFLDSTKFKHFEYAFGPEVMYQNKSMMSINFKAKKTVEHLVHEGTLLIDVKSNAIVSLQYSADFVIPVLIRPILFTYGLSINLPKMTKTVRYQYYNDRWYPDYFHLFVKADLEKRHLFSSNEKSHFELKQVLKINEINLQSEAIPAEKIYQPTKKIESQIYEESNISWTEVNTF